MIYTENNMKMLHSKTLNKTKYFAIRGKVLPEFWVIYFFILVFINEINEM